MIAVPSGISRTAPGTTESQRAKFASNVGIRVLFAAGLVVGMAYGVFFGTILLALGVLLLAIRGYMGSSDRAVTGVMTF